MAKPTTADRLNAARIELEATTRQLAECSAARNRALLTDDDRQAAKLASQIDDLRQLARGHEDKIKLLQIESENEAAARRAKEKAALIERIEKKVSERDAAGAELAAAIMKADAAFRRMISLGREISAAWPWLAHDLPPCMLTPDAITHAVRHELFRVGARPLLVGGMDKNNDGISFPGGKCPRIELLGRPDQVTPLGDVLSEASSLATQIMRTGVSTSGRTVAPVEGVPAALRADPPPRTEAEQRLAQLLLKQAQLALDVTPEGEKKYREIVAELTVVQGEITTAGAVS